MLLGRLKFDPMLKPECLILILKSLTILGVSRQVLLYQFHKLRLNCLFPARLYNFILEIFKMQSYLRKLVLIVRHYRKITPKVGSARLKSLFVCQCTVKIGYDCNSSDQTNITQPYKFTVWLNQLSSIKSFSSQFHKTIILSDIFKVRSAIAEVRSQNLNSCCEYI